VFDWTYAVVASLVELSASDCVVAVVPLGNAGVPERFAAVPLVLFERVDADASTIWPEPFVPTIVLDTGTAAPLTLMTVATLDPEVVTSPESSVAAPVLRASPVPVNVACFVPNPVSTYAVVASFVDPSA